MDSLTKKYAAIIFLFFLGFIVILYTIPQWLVTPYGITDPKNLAEEVNSYRTTLAQVLGGFAVIVGIFISIETLNTAQNTLNETIRNNNTTFVEAQSNLNETIRNNQTTLENVKDGQITDRFIRAIDQLGKERMEVKIGGIYALERVSKESDKDYSPIMEILTAYIRTNSPYKRQLDFTKDPGCENMDQFEYTEYLNKKQTNDLTFFKFKKEVGITEDIAAALLVIGNRRKTREKEPYNLLLYNTNLQNVDFSKNHFDSVSFAGSSLIWSCFTGADLKNANFAEAKLNYSNFEDANLTGANLREADLTGAKITDDQLFTVKTFHKAKLDDGRREVLEKNEPEKYRALAIEPKTETSK